MTRTLTFIRLEAQEVSLVMVEAKLELQQEFIVLVLKQKELAR